MSHAWFQQGSLTFSTAEFTTSGFCGWQNVKKHIYISCTGTAEFEGFFNKIMVYILYAQHGSTSEGIQMGTL